MLPNEHIWERVVDRIPRVDDAVSVGEDLDFQRRWWRFEKAAWLLLAVVLIADALGAFGRGWLAQAELTAADGSMCVHYERVERTGTPSEMTIEFGPSAVHDQKVRMFASQTTVKELGAQRIIPPADCIANRSRRYHLYVFRGRLSGHCEYCHATQFPRRTPHRTSGTRF